MQQVKIFHDTEDRVDVLEQEVNAWLRESKARIVQITGNIAPQALLETEQLTRVQGAAPNTKRRFAPSDVLLIVVYETY